MSLLKSLKCRLVSVFILSGCFLISASAQNHTVSGVVTDDQGPMVGVSVMVKGCMYAMDFIPDSHLKVYQVRRRDKGIKSLGF